MLDFLRPQGQIDVGQIVERLANIERILANGEDVMTALPAAAFSCETEAP
jgi:hypothetical protein